MPSNIGLSFVLPSLALVAGICSGGYLLWWSWLHRGTPHARAAILWATALFLMFWGQIPAILIGFGEVIVVNDFNLFFALTFPATLLALVFLYAGVRRIAGRPISQTTQRMLVGWFIVALAYFMVTFVVRGGVIESYASLIIGVAFFMLLRLYIIKGIWGMIRSEEIRGRDGMLGAGLLITEAFVGLSRNVALIDSFLSRPPQYWYVGLARSPIFFIAMTASIVLLVAGFYYLHVSFLRHASSSR